MKTCKHNVIWVILLCTTVAFSQKQTKKISESFKVNKDVLIEINARSTDVEVIEWNKNEVSIEGVLEVDGITKEEAIKYFESWNFEALGNADKVIITSKSKRGNHLYTGLFDNFNFDFEPFAQLGELFKGGFQFEMPEFPEMPEMPEFLELLEMPEFPESLLNHLSEVEFDHEAYKKDKEGYMKKFEKQQKKWEKEFEPQMKAYEEKIKKWEKKNEPKMKEMEAKMKKWEKENEPKMKVFEAKMKKWEKENEPKVKELEEKMEKMEKEIEKKYNEKIIRKDGLFLDAKINAKIVIKVPKNATVKVDARYGTITLPDNLNTKN